MKAGSASRRFQGTRLARGAGASALALAAAAVFAPGEARAQATPGSAECPIVDRIVTCSGDLSDGVSVPAGADRDGLTVENITGDVSVTTRPAIAFTAGTALTTIDIADPDSALRLDTTGTDLSGIGLDRTAAVVLATAANNTTFSLVSDIDIFGTHGCTVNCASSRRLALPSGILVRGSLGNFSIDNRGDITIDNDDDGVGVSAAAIVADIFGADLVSIFNSGTLTVHNGPGILATADNHRIEITNDGAIILTADTVAPFSYGIFLTFDSEQRYADGYVRSDAPTVTDFSYSIVNNGTVGGGTPPAADSLDFLPAIVVTNDYSETIPGGITSFMAGRQTGEIVNNGTLTGTDGIYVSQNGDVTITNNGLIDATFYTGWSNGQAINVQQLISEVGTVGDVSLTRIINTAQGVIEAAGENKIGILAYGGVVEISNAGTIEVTGETAIGMLGGGSSGSVIRRNAERVTMSNTGQILVSGANSRGIELERFHPVTANRAPDQHTIITNSGTIIATGTDADGIRVENLAPVSNPELENIGTAEIELSATSIVRGGSDSGTGIRFTGGESSTVENAGLITATSGSAIVGGSGAETIDNSGDIEGTVALGDGDDRIIARVGGFITGAVDGGAGSDAIAFDVTGDTVAFADRIGGAASGFELLEKTGAGVLTLDAAVAGRTALDAGGLRTTGDLGAMHVDAAAGTTLEAIGALGQVTIASGATLSAGGTDAGTLQLASLVLGADAISRFDLGEAGTVGGANNDLIEVTGDLVLDGQVDVIARFGFGDGVYRLFTYGGTLTDNGLDLGAVPTADYEIQTASAGQVNLVVGNFVDILFWDDGDSVADGQVDGGDGTWNAANTNWTNADGTQNRAWSPGFAVFQGAVGTVTVEGAQAVNGMQFVTSGYRLVAGTDGSIVLANDESVVRVDSGVTAELALPLTGTGALVKRDLGTLILSGTNTHGGGTQVREGVLEISSDAALGSGGLTLDGGTLRAGASFDSSRSITIAASGGTFDTQGETLTLSGALTGPGALTKAGSGILTLDGDGGGYTGAARIAAGTLNLNGALGGTLLIDSGATLTGVGTTGSLTVNGIIAPGNSAGTLTVNGNLILGASSNYMAELAASGPGDTIVVTGTAQLNGGTLTLSTLSPELDFTDGSDIRILEAAGGVTGTFGQLIETSAFLDFALGYTDTAVDVRVTVVRTFPEVAQTFNQRNAASGLHDFARTTGSDSLIVYNTILLLDDAPARAAFDAASGEIYAVLLASQQRQGQASASRFAMRSLGQEGEGWSVWGGVLGLSGHVADDGNGARFTQDLMGTEFGMGYDGAGGRWAVGIGGGFGRSGANLPGRDSNADIDGWHLGAYGRAGTGGAGFTALAALVYEASDAEVTRTIAFGTIDRDAASAVDVETASATAEVRYGFGSGDWAFGPTAAVYYSHTSLSRFAEAGAQSLDIAGDAQSDGGTRYAGGLFARYSGKGSRIDASVRAIGGDRGDGTVTLRMAGAPDNAYRVQAALGDTWGVEGTLAGEAALGDGWSLGGHARLIASGDESQIAGQAVLRLRF